MPRLCSSSRNAARATLLVLAFAAAPVAAQVANLTLSRDVALWSDSLRAGIEGVGCTGEVRVTSIRDGIVTIELEGCSAGSTTPFSTVIGPFHLYPGDYTVRVRDAAHRSKVLDTAPLIVYPVANLSVELPQVPTDAAPFTLLLKGLSRSICTFADLPVVEGHVISITLSEGCPFLDVPLFEVFETEAEVGPLPAGEYEVRFFRDPVGPYPTRELHRRTIVVHAAPE